MKCLDNITAIHPGCLLFSSLLKLSAGVSVQLCSGLFGKEQSGQTKVSHTVSFCLLRGAHIPLFLAGKKFEMKLVLTEISAGSLLRHCFQRKMATENPRKGFG